MIYLLYIHNVIITEYSTEYCAEYYSKAKFTEYFELFTEYPHGILFKNIIYRILRNNGRILHEILSVVPDWDGPRDIAFSVQDGVKKPLVGSCCTLVAERMLDRAPDALSPEMARLLLGVILIDTNNIDLATGRATPRDVTATEQLLNRSRINRASTKALFDTLRNAKFDPGFWNTLSVRDCLRYDYKQFIPAGGSTIDKGQRTQKFGMSSILCRIETLAIKPDVSAAVREFSLERGLDCLAVMTTTLDGSGSIRKELLVFAENERRSEQIREFLESSPQVAFLRLRRKEGTSCLSSENNGSFLWWEMENAVPSRKQIAPVILSFYESLG